MLKDPERAVERARAKVTQGHFTPGTWGAALGSIVGSGLGAFESTVTGGAIGFLLGRFRGRVAEAWVQNDKFVRWATGLQGKSITDAVGTFITDVAPQNLPGTDELLGEMLDAVAGTIAGTYVAQGTGSPALGVATGAAVNIGMDQARALANDMLREGERVWQELIGNPDPRGE
jgi:hypothetical protein